MRLYTAACGEYELYLFAEKEINEATLLQWLLKHVPSLWISVRPKSCKIKSNFLKKSNKNLYSSLIGKIPFYVCLGT